MRDDQLPSSLEHLHLLLPRLRNMFWGPPVHVLHPLPKVVLRLSPVEFQELTVHQPIAPLWVFNENGTGQRFHDILQ